MITYNESKSTMYLDLKNPNVYVAYTENENFKQLAESVLDGLNEPDRTRAKEVYKKLKGRDIRLFFLKSLSTFPLYISMENTFAKGAVSDAHKLKLSKDETKGYIQYKREIAMIKIAEYRLDALSILLARLKFVNWHHNLFADVDFTSLVNSIKNTQHDILRFKYLYPALEWSN